MSLIQQYGNVAADGQIATSTTPAKVSALVAAASLALPLSCWGYSLVNNDATNTVYIGFSNGVSSTNYYRALGPGASHQIDAGMGVLNRLYIVAGAGTPAVHLTVFQ